MDRLEYCLSTKAPIFKLNISFYQLRDLAGATYSVPLKTNVGIQFANECTALQITYTRDKSYNVDIPAATNLSFNIKLFGF